MFPVLPHECRCDYPDLCQEKCNDRKLKHYAGRKADGSESPYVGSYIDLINDIRTDMVRSKEMNRKRCK
jgi:hypothetical protein